MKFFMANRFHFWLTIVVVVVVLLLSTLSTTYRQQTNWENISSVFFIIITLNEFVRGLLGFIFFWYFFQLEFCHHRCSHSPELRWKEKRLSSMMQIKSFDIVMSQPNKEVRNETKSIFSRLIRDNASLW